MQSQKYKTAAIFSGLLLLMLLTRGSHFGTSFLLPDATLAIFLLSGLVFPRFTLPALAAFIFLLLMAGGIDYYAINVAGVSDWCVTPAYGFLIPTYATMWLGGSWFASKLHNTWRSLLLFAGISWLTTTAAFLISNSSFYLLSGRYSEMNATEYAGRVVQYYTSYLGGSLLYLGLAAAIYILFSVLKHLPTATAN